MPSGGTVQAPVALLLDPALTAAAKVLWLAIGAQSQPVTPAYLAAQSALTPVTVRKCLAVLEAAGWYSPSAGPVKPSPSDARVVIPVSLLPDPRVRPQAKLVYGLLQTVPAFRDRSGEFTYTALSSCTRLSAVTLRQVVRELADSGWIQVTQATQKAPIRFTLDMPDLDQSNAEVAAAARRLEEAHYRGEAIMREYLSLLIDSDEFEDNARPGFLINPLTGERLELDRYYPPAAAFEYNGDQHYRVTKRYPGRQALSKRQARDLMKAGHCAHRGIRLTVIHREDLTLERMLQKFGTLLPLRDLSGHEELLRFLEQASK